jgi:hypothetical protein
MTFARGAAPKSRSASFRNLDDQAAAIGDWNRGETGAGSGHESKYQRGAQYDRSNHNVFLPDC